MKPRAESPSCSETAPRTLLELLQKQAHCMPDACAYTFRWDDGSENTLTFAQLDFHARRIAATLQTMAQPGDRALLVFTPGLDFITAFFGCVYAGVLAVPATYPKPRRPMPRLSAIADDCRATLALTTSQTLSTLDLGRAAPHLQPLQWVATDALADESVTRWQCPAIGSEDLAFLQYTSGSTSEPKGVMLSHGNLLHNLEMICQGFDIRRIIAEVHTSNNGVTWLPAYHDMGLIGGILEPLYVGGHQVLMSPASFLQRPLRWLKAISDYRAVVSGAPNFAYELCVRKITAEQRATLDLSSWQVAFCGAEPIRPETLAQFAEAFAPCGFRAEAFYPCYGLAEATLLAAGGRGPARPTLARVGREALAKHRVVRAAADADANQTQELVTCGYPLMDQQIAIVDPETRTCCPPDRVGEIWIQGPNIAQGYWNRAEENQETFAARLAENGDGPYLRTGDLGFINDGRLCVTGRVKDVIIIRGRNHYPQDIELTVENSHPALQAGAGAAFSIEWDGRERLITIHEIERQHRTVNFEEVIRNIRRNVAQEHELDVHAVVLIRQANLPRTTSGKVQRNLCRELYLAGQFKTMAQWIREGAGRAGGNQPNDQDTQPVAGNGAAKWSAVSGNGNGSAETKQPAAAATAGSVKPISAGGNGMASPPLGTRPAAAASHSFPPLVRPDQTLRPEEIERLAQQIESAIMEWLVQRAGVSPNELAREKPFAEYGLDSLTAVELSQELEDWLKIELTPVIAWNYPTLESLARYLAGHFGETGKAEVALESPVVAAPQQPAPNDFERMLAEIETLSDEEAQAALNREPGRS